MEWEGQNDPVLSPEEVEKGKQKEKEKQELVDQLRALVKKAPEYGFVSEDLLKQLWDAVNQLYKY